MRVGLYANTSKPAAAEASQRLAEFLTHRGIAYLTQPDDDTLASCDFLVVFGGDGTLLAAARRVAATKTPLLGVHLGRFGFLTETSIETLFPVVESVLAGNYERIERPMVQGIVRRTDGSAGPTLTGLNDVVVTGKAARMVHIRTRVGGKDLATYAADGVIVATPTGSTGYSLSAGGPLVHPTTPALIVTPIAPHTLSARALVVPDTETVSLTVEGETRDAVIVTVDGQVEEPLTAGDTVLISRAPHSVTFLSAGGPDFYEKIRTRWHYAERLNR